MGLLFRVVALAIGLVFRLLGVLLILLLNLLVGLLLAILPWLWRGLILALSLMAVSFAALRSPVRSADFLAESWLYRLMSWGLPPESLDAFRPVFKAVAYFMFGLGWLFTICIFVLVVRIVFG